MDDPRPTRSILINNSQQLEKFCSNSISTCKYSVLNFLFKFLFEQFKKYSNIFFLMIALFQQIPNVSPTGRYTTALPLIIILCCSATKEAFEDFKRYIEDKKTNEKRVLVMRDGQWLYCRWSDVKVGDIAKITDRDFFPADLLLLSSSEPEGLCYVETSNLDGETNLKARKAHPSTYTLVNAEMLRELSGSVVVDAPNRHLYEFSGVMRLSTEPAEVPLDHDHILLRGSQLRNTKWAFGLVIYTGMETKLFLNSRDVPFKRSNLDKQVNRQILLMLVFLVLISLVSTVTSVLIAHNSLQDHWYIQFTDQEQNVFLTFLTFVILYNNLIPISLTVTIEIVKFMQAYFISWDLDMYDEVTDTSASARTSNLNEELGQIGFIFSDKTGTLTMNEMVFRCCLVGDHVYGSLQEENKFADQILPLISSQMDDDSILYHFVMSLMTCHTVIPTRRFPTEDEVDSGSVTLIYNASSPDEFALLSALKEVGIILVERTPTTLTMELNGRTILVKILHVIEFTSARKMMSVVIEDERGRIIVYCKGADSAIFSKLAKSSLFQHETERYLSNFAEQGLRTLCLAYRELSAEEYKEWSAEWAKATSSKSDRKRLMSLASERIEIDLLLCGATGIEDKLQKEVPDTIALFRDAGINVWVLTGDKIETAVNIAYSCELFCDESTVFTLDVESKEEFGSTIHTLTEEVKKAGLQGEFSMVLSGKNLEYAFEERYTKPFLDLALSCRAVMCCRVTPKQKADVVDLIRKNTKKLTLAIGDGANDVAMIKAAHVGVGIHGREGTQAACASDYSIAQFRFLKKLLFVHGVWNYRRLCKVILYSYYKNICLYIIELWFALFSAFSGQVLFERWTLGLYNVLFTAAPPIVLGLFDRCPEPEAIFKYPHIYKYTQDKQDFNVAVFWTWILNGVYHSAVLFFATYFATRKDVVTKDGKTFGSHIYVGCFVYTYVVTTVGMKALLMMDSWTKITNLAVWLSILSWFLFLPLYSMAWPTFPIAEDIAGMAVNVYKSPVFWLGLLLIPWMALLADMIYAAVQRTMFPTVLQKVQHTQRMPTGIFAPFPTRRRRADRVISRKLAAIRSIFSRKDAILQAAPRAITYHGFAFSQEEDGVVPQSQLIRSYNTNDEESSEPSRQ